jgi:hypothetical protein
MGAAKELAAAANAANAPTTASERRMVVSFEAAVVMGLSSMHKVRLVFVAVAGDVCMRRFRAGRCLQARIELVPIANEFVPTPALWPT